MIGSTIQKSRLEKGMSLGMLAERAGVNKSTLSRWEAGKNKPSIREINLVFDALDLPEPLRRECLRGVNQPRSTRHLSAITTPATQSEMLPVSGGEMLRALRIRVGVTQADAARAVGVTQGLLSRWEHNDCWPEPTNLHVLCHVLRATEGEIRGLTQHAWKNHEELPLDKEELDMRLHRLKDNDQMTQRDLVYLAFAGRYMTLRRQHKISDLEAMEVWGAYAYHLSGLGRAKDARQMAEPIFHAIHRSTSVLTRGQFEGLFAITSNLNGEDMPKKQYFPTREIILRFKDRIAPSRRGQWLDGMGMITWHCARTTGLAELSAESDAYYEQAVESETTLTGQWTRRRCFAGLICSVGRYEEALHQLQLAAPLPPSTRIAPQIEYEQTTAWALAGLGDKQAATRHLNKANSMLAAYPDFVEREDRLYLANKLNDLIEGKPFSVKL
jgi:transcriptional regulator with XRE-family HTH domain